MGPGGGDEGGQVVFEGTPEAIIEDPISFTGKFLKKILKPRKYQKNTVNDNLLQEIR
jgi:excinuclease ABC subunit A